jgi:hypothetical protein
VSRRTLSHLANIEVRITRNDSPWVKFSIEGSPDITPLGGMDSEDGLYTLNEEIRLLETSQIELPDSIQQMPFDQMATLRAELWGDWYSYETDYGTEYNAEFEFRGEQVTFAPL